jgi:hypothetical protein
VVPGEGAGETTKEQVMTFGNLLGVGIGLYALDSIDRRHHRRRRSTSGAVNRTRGTYKAFAQLTAKQKADVKKQMKPPYTGRTYRVVGGKVVSRK